MKGEYVVTELNNKDVSEELFLLFGEVLDLVKFDENMYDTDLSYIFSSL